MMTARDYLEQSWYLDRQIDSRMMHLEKLNGLLLKSSVLTADSCGGHSDVRGNESCIVKIIDLKKKINEEISELIDLKSEIAGLIKSIDNREYQLLLELRYINMAGWTEVAERMGYTRRFVYMIHNNALAEVDRLLHQIAA